MGAVETARDALFGNPPVSNMEPSREGILAAFAELQRETVSLATPQVYATWADLNADPGAAGESAVIYDDAGTHTDPVVGGTVSNTGVYLWSVSPAGWERIADTEAFRAKEYADVAEAAAAAALAGTEAFGAVSYTSNSVSSGTNAFGPDGSPIKDGFLRSISVRVQAAATYKAFIVNAGIVQWEQVFTAGAGGVNTHDLLDIPFPAGSHIYVNMISGALNYDFGGTSRYFAMSDYSGSIGDSVTEITGNPLSVSISYEVGYAPSLAKVEDIDARLDAAESVSPTRIDDFGITAPDGATVSDGSNAFGPDGSPTQDGFLTEIAVRVAGATTYEAYIVDADGVVIWDQTFSAAGSGVDTRQIADAYFPAGAHLYVRSVSGSGLRFVAGGTSRYFAIAGYSGVGDTVSEITANPITMAIAYSIRYAIVPVQIDDLNKKVDAAGGSSRDDRIVDAEAEISSLTLDTAALISINGFEQAIADSRSFTATSGSDERYDVLYYDVVAGAFGVEAGTARATDAPEFIPALDEPNHLPVFNIRVTASAISVVPVWNVLNGEDRSLASSLELERNRSRACLRKTIQRIRRGQSLHILGFGDSITAIQAETPSTSTPNGQYRDRGTASGTSNTYLRDNIGSDVVNAIPTYSAAALGRTPDAHGSIYTRVGFNWELVAALEGIGYTLGTDLNYDNFGQGGYQTSDAATGGSLTAFGTAAVGVGADVVVLAFGMNEIGGANTEANTVTLINAFKAAGTDVIVMGCPRPRTLSVPGWIITVRAQERAARYAGAAFVGTLELFDDRSIGAVGMTGGDVCVANAINHPGLLEHRMLGRALTKLVLD